MERSGPAGSTAGPRDFIVCCSAAAPQSSLWLVDLNYSIPNASRSVAEHSGAPWFFLDCASVFRRERGKAERYVQVLPTLGRPVEQAVCAVLPCLSTAHDLCM